MHLFIVRLAEGESIELLAFVNKHQAEIISSRVFLVDLTKCWREVKTAKEKSDRNSFSS